MKHLYKVLFVTASLFSSLSYSAEVKNNLSPITIKKMLIITSNMIDMGDKDKHDARNNLWEVAPPFHVFMSHGVEVDFVSPKGGKVEFMMDPLGISSYAIKYEGFLDKTAHTFSPDLINPNDYWGVYIGGGYGPLFDVTPNKKLQTIIQTIYESGGIVGAGGHGAGAFANVQLSDGTFLVKGKKVAGFPNSTEITKSWAKQGSLLPFLVETQLNKNGAIAQNKQTLNDKHDVVIDERIVSTMFLPSAALVAKEMILLNDNKKVAQVSTLE
ncbi:type 1 glutamine amidotransferase domain-containing protein [Shewanella surugensis]|uniref:Type 1 glutamine amidotransferase domain-containing protein n=1 Tax=Shewanella surugensis TaxID=212020 RepID=A0ABT0LFC6_9GAMM|nr:type 1 glutamine amidotransferase domain-containing protein [Shewanella surugensis]MCL1126264.1 type 1 glutamine amidotransferase domain-containing protein [Shewanella surugensis]